MSTSSTTPRALMFAVIGSPVAHSQSPAMHAAAYKALGLPHVYTKLETSLEELPARITALRDGLFAGLNVTVPHKTSVLSLVDRLDVSASVAGAANTLVRSADGSICAHNTDAPALREELVRLSNDAQMFRGRSAIVLGTGGVARAAIFALGQLGIARVIVRGREMKDDLAAILAASGSPGKLFFEPFAAPCPDPPDVAAVIQATTAGMAGSGVAGSLVADAVQWSKLPTDSVVYDVIYTPPRTELLRHAAAHNLRTESGLGMLARQGALAFELWLGRKAPLDVMRAALGQPPPTGAGP